MSVMWRTIENRTTPQSIIILTLKKEDREHSYQGQPTAISRLSSNCYLYDGKVINDNTFVYRESMWNKLASLDLGMMSNI